VKCDSLDPETERPILSYVQEIDALKDRRDFYNTLTTDCTTNVLMHTRANAGRRCYT
jgi:hypothetical protein